MRVALGSVLKPAESVELIAYEVRPDGKMDTLRQLLYAETGQTLVFARTKRGAERIAKSLGRDGFNAAMIHGDRSQSQRNKALSGFQDGQFQVLVATDIASRGCMWTMLPTSSTTTCRKSPKILFTALDVRDGRDLRAVLYLVTGAEMVELRQIERALKLRIERRQMDAAGVEQPKRLVQNTLASRTLTALPGEVFV